MKRGTENILVVDDEPDTLMVLSEMLKPLGYQIFCAPSGEAALDFAEKSDTNIDLLLTDVLLPRIKGHELAKILSKRYPELKVIYMSGYFCPQIPEEEHLKRQKAFVQKPFSAKRIAKTLREILDSPLF